MNLIRLYARVLGQLGPERRLGVWLGGANVMLAAAAFAEPILFGRIVDGLYALESPGGHARFPAIAWMLATWASFGLFTIAASVFVALHADRMAHRRRLAVIAEHFEHSLRLPQGFHAEVHSGRALKIMFEGAQSMFWLWLSLFRQQAASFATVILLLPLTLFLDLRMGSLLVALVVVFGVLTWQVVQRTHALQGDAEKLHSELAERASDAIGNLPVVQSFTRIEAEVEELRGTIARLLSAQIPVLSWWAVVSVATRASSTLAVLAIFLLGAYLNVHGLLSVGQIVTFTSLSGILIGRLDQIVNFCNFAFSQSPKIEEFFNVLDTTPAVRDRVGAIALGRISGRVRFENVSFSYDGKRRAVEQLSFEVEAGETVALVGTTGSGKSTTLSLLHRAFDPQSGRIFVDGIDIRDVTLASLRRNVGVVFQEPMLFARTIRENVLVGNTDATDAELVAALGRAQATEIIMRQPDGLDAPVGERGRSLSGGERQRLSIARALLKNPPILVLDEATSALDAATEAKLKRALDEATRGRTTFIIAHRLATIRNASRILVFDEGRIVEEGTFDALVAAGGRFAELAKAQFMVAHESPA
jgi:ATP-binding cassette subfamily B protein